VNEVLERWAWNTSAFSASETASELSSFNSGGKAVLYLNNRLVSLRYIILKTKYEIIFECFDVNIYNKNC